ncbi:MAG: tail fiber domain-containing protein, partial [Psychroserpens sp.]|uniref:tail fiber domain-containing protein n=1 Tax=Psychroserpens sp. TaxID=2020870 RepID=UPI003CB4B7AC
PISFNWKDQDNPDTKLGLIAQDLQILIPEVVHTHIWEKNETTGALTKKELDRLGVYYSDLVPVLIKAIQEQQAVIKSLHSKIDYQENVNLNQSNTLEVLLTRVDLLEQMNNK